MIDQKQIEEWRKLCDGAKPGPWEIGYWSVGDAKSGQSWVGSEGVGVVATSLFGKDDLGDMAFIASARTALPQLLDEIDRLNAIINHKIEGYTLRYSVSATGTYNGASAEGKTVEEAVRALGEKLESMARSNQDGPTLPSV